ncbi:ribonucleoside-diphosphate reductase alpha chain/ribonucleoside-triphosphate reductase [Anaerovirgula multivorans]|uniref:Adenosylcobalamin-dependent ribonucleoside-triphosphate reductase n=1 Tax=Anaerovirgula multivorans TaxID=312168 RepID=A0A239CKY9_9FIRM|nr:ribonucleoside-triphosphate reductase, adenosylcobalamin-dependent [Anaerovirgula multivorans]SNS20827.1 ribonucleoside-diphosphate reductase alpha chain/ribonucleoside-triphosphate reductase [Anaerovirgula multivorans]
MLLSDKFLEKYKHIQPPMTELGSFVYYRTYSRWLSSEGRREYWWETVRRAVEYNCSLAPTPVEEAERLYDNIFHLRQFLSGRTFWVGQTPVTDKYPTSNFNCCATVVDEFEAFRDIFYLLMVGAGVGVRLLPEDVAKLPKILNHPNVEHIPYEPMSKYFRDEHTSLNSGFDSSHVWIAVGDSKDGWVQALDYLLQMFWRNDYREIKTVTINYNSVRPKGEKLKTFGGRASGHESLKIMFEKLVNVLMSKGTGEKLEPIDCLDIANIIAENVVVGGVRRSSEIAIIDVNDKDCMEAKANLYSGVDGKWEINTDLSHRQMSNNSILYRSKPTREQLKKHLEQVRYTGEPGWMNEEAALKRNPNFKLPNPCGEILLDSRGMCNLTTVNVHAFVTPDGGLDLLSLVAAQMLSARAGLRMSTVELELPKWNTVQHRDRLLGCSLTGWQDTVNAMDMCKELEVKLLNILRVTAEDEAREYAEELGVSTPILVTTEKPEGSLSQLPTVSSGVHYSHSPYYIRRVRISAHDPLLKVCEELGYPVFPEVGQDPENCSTKVVEFPVKAPEGKTKADVSAIEQLENYKLFMDNYVNHNCSITVTVKDDEWGAVEDWIWDNWDSIVAITLLSDGDHVYDLMPYEAIGEEEFTKRAGEMKSFDPGLISKYEQEETEIDVGTDSCESGLCPIR